MNEVVSVGSAPCVSREADTRELLSLARARVRKRLERAADFPILVVSAPAGFGKSTVIREFFAARPPAYRYVELESARGDVLEFMRGFAECLSDLAPALLTSVMGVYERLHRSADAPKEIAAWAAGHLEPIAITLIIDGLAEATDPRLFGLLNALVDQTSSAQIRWVLVTESADQFPVARWMANDRMDLPLDDVDLALTFDDLEAAATMANAPISRTALAALCRTTANWPASIALALADTASLTQRGDAAQTLPYRYFAQRALAARPAREGRFLLETCLYKHFDAAVLAAAGWDDAQLLVESLSAAGAFLYAHSPGVYRYHDIFRAFLIARLQERTDGLYERISMTSAAVCRRVGRWADALEIYTVAQASAPLAELLAEHGFELVDRGEADSVYRALGALGDADYAAFPVALAVKASLESLHGSFDLAEAWFRHAIKIAGSSSVRGPIVFRFATDLVRQDRRDAIDLLQPIVEEGGHELALSVSLAGLLATAYATDAQIDRAASTIELALTRMIDIDDRAVRAKLYYQAGYVAIFARDPTRAKRYATQAVETALASHLYDIAARALSILYNVAVDYEHDLQAGRLYLDQLAACSVKAGSRPLLIYATLGQFEIEVCRGNLDESGRLDEKLKTLEIDYSTFASEMLLPAQALRATWTGDFHRAYRLIATTAEKQITPLRRAQRYAEIAVYAAAAGLHAEAATAVRSALTGISESDAADIAGAFTVAFTNVYIVLALGLMGRHQRAARVLAALERSGSLTPRLEALIHATRAVIGRWAGGRYRIDLREALEELDACDFGGIRRFIEALPLPETFRGQIGLLSAPLREVLIHLCAGLDSDEIAVLSGRSVADVDVLIGALCRNLGCTSVRHAVARAQSFDSEQSFVVERR